MPFDGFLFASRVMVERGPHKLFCEGSHRGRVGCGRCQMGGYLRQAHGWHSHCPLRTRGAHPQGRNTWSQARERVRGYGLKAAEGETVGMAGRAQNGGDRQVECRLRQAMVWMEEEWVGRGGFGGYDLRGGDAENGQANVRGEGGKVD